MINHFFQKNTLNLLVNTIISTAVATLALNPLHVILTRYAVFDTTKNPLIFKNIVKKMYKNEGIAGFYKGFTL